MSHLEISTAELADEAFAQPGSPYAELVWLPVLGPASFLLWRHLARRLLRSPAGFTVDTRELSATLGLGLGDGSQTAMARTVRRIQRFEVARFDAPNSLLIPTALPPAPRQQLARLHPIVRWHHDRLLDVAPAPEPPSPDQAAHSRPGRDPLPA
jgi:hypothetical protein